MNITAPKLTLDAEWGRNDPEVESVWQLLKDAASKVDNAQMKDESDFRADRVMRNSVKQEITIRLYSRTTSNLDLFQSKMRFTMHYMEHYGALTKTV